MSVQNVDIIFGSDPESIFSMIDSGETLENIRKKTGHTVAVSGASLSLKEGEIVVLMGLSGSGKSSLLRAFNGLNPVSRGQVCFGNQPVSDFMSFRRNQISMVFQSSALLPWRNIFDNIALGLEFKNLEPSKISKLVTQNLERVGLEAWSQSYPRELSGGMQQRVGLARALATESPILLMDEPFSALDPMIRSQLQQELLKLQKDLKKTILFVSHDLNEALLLGNRIAILDKGRIIQIGTPHEITSNPVNAHVSRFVAMAEKHCGRCASKFDA
ncbi:MAG: ATP-binding cassette domain-containing protein [Myxococcaceae bacterium]